MIPLQLHAQLEPFGLEGKRVTSLTIYQQTLFAATDSQGVYRRDLNNPAAGWISLGLTELRLRSVFPYQVDSARFFLFVGAVPTFRMGDTVLVYRWGSEDGKWIPCDSGMVRRSSGVFAMHGIPSRKLLYAGGPAIIQHAVYKYEDGYWKKIYEAQPPHVLRIFSLYVDLRTEIVLAGGVTFLSAPFLARSPDRDLDWKRIPIGGWWFYSASSVSSVVAAPDSVGTIYSGAGGFLLVTRDDGMTWQKLLEEQGSFSSIVTDSMNPNRIYVGYDSLDNFKLLETVDRGRTWSTVKLLEQRKGITAMVLDPLPRTTIYIATRGDGVFRYRSLLMNVEERHEVPLAFHLGQNYPNPFNQMTTIDLYAEGNSESVPLEIYDLLGRKIHTLEAARVTQGLYRVRWNGRNIQGKELSSGVYFYKAQIGERSAIRSMMLLK